MGNVFSLMYSTFFGPRQIETAKSVAFREFVRSNMDKLPHMMNIEDDLLTHLLSDTLLTNEQYEKVRDQASSLSKIETLFAEILNEPPSDSNYEKFLLALDDTHHKHVSNFIRGGGNYQTEFGEEWPLRDKEKVRFDQQRQRIVTKMDSINGLLVEMFADGVISSVVKDHISHIQDNRKRNEELCAVLRRGSHSSFLKFMRCLELTDQHHIVSIIDPENSSGIPPLSEDCERLLTLNYAFLTKNIDTQSGLIAALFASECITMRQKQYIESTPLPDRAEKLLDMVMRGSQLGYGKFIDGLNDTGQKHVAKIIQEGNVIAEVKAEFAVGDGEDRTLVEDSIVQQINSFLEGRCKSPIAELVKIFPLNLPLEKQEELIAKLTDQIDKFHLSAAKKGNSIHLFYSLRSLADFDNLRGVYSSGKLTSDLHMLFTLLSSSGRGVHLSLPHLSWPEQNWNICARHLYALENLTTLAGIYELAAGRRMETVCNASFNKFRIELRETILMRTVGVLFCGLSRKTPKAHVFSYATLRAVSKEWNDILANRRYNLQLLRKSFKRYLHPFKRNPQQLSVIHCNQKVCGVAELNGKLYVASSESGVIHVYESSDPFEQLHTVTITHLRAPIDMIACAHSSRLYVAVTEVPAIWRVRVTHDGLDQKQVDKFIETSWNPLSISLYSTRLLVIPNNGESIFRYHDDGKLMKRIPLPDYMKTTHAVEILHGSPVPQDGGQKTPTTSLEATSTSTYIVSYRLRFRETIVKHDSISEVNDNGVVVRHVVNPFDGSDVINFNMPYYLSLDADGHVFVADVRNERVVVVSILPSCLHVKRVLLTSLGGQPRRLCFSRETGLLYVVNWYSTEVAVFPVLQLKPTSLVKTLVN